MLYIGEEFIEMLMSISDELYPEDLENMKFIMGEHLPNRELQNVEMPIDLFRLMMRLEIFSESKLDPLVQLLIDVKRYDLSSKLPQIKGKQ